MTIQDQELLGRYLRERSEEAFNELVRRHLRLVYSAASRQVRDAHMAQDVTQTVFANLARKAGSIPSGMSLEGWLHRDTRFTVLDALRSENRRRQREEKAAAMQQLESDGEPDWAAVRPVIDEALGELEAADRDILLLRYFEGRAFSEIGDRLGSSAEAMRKRVERALERLRGPLERKGVVTTASALGVTLSTHAMEVVPPGLVGTLMLSVVGSGTGAAVSVATVAFSTPAKLWMGVSLVSAALVIPWASQQLALAGARSENQILRERDAALAGNRTLGAGVTTELDAANRERADLERLRGEVGVLRQQLAETRSRAEVNRSTVVDPHLPKAQAIIRLSELSDSGQATPANLMRTMLWSIIHGDTNRMRQLMAFNPALDEKVVQEIFEDMQEEVSQGEEAVLEHLPFSEFRVLGQEDAGDGDVWLEHEYVLKSGGLGDRSRTKLRPNLDGWRIVARDDGQSLTEVLEERGAP
jgi:RNA polymerase sigma factor (sigma-70 family)